MGVDQHGGRYSQGWSKGGSGETIPAPCMKGKTFSQIKADCQKSGKPWEDPDFPANDATINPKQKPRKPLVWKRPPELTSDPKMFVGGASRFDIQQGELGDCWLLASVASLCQNEDALQGVVPHDQDFDKDYIGAFRFNFWQFGQWMEVVVDDRLPTHQDRLVYLHSASNNEFWTALFEKAYAKLFGSYEALSGGNATEAMEDFTGGVTEVFDTRKELPANFYQILYKARERNSLMGCSIEDAPGQVETALPSGLIAGHAYSLTDVKILETGGKKVQLVRVRNPWGNEHEWKGAWSDSSSEWKNISETKRKEMGLSFDNDGEFWMTFDDFKANFHRVEICNLSPDELGEEAKQAKRRWEVSVKEGMWKKNVNAGGCINNRETFWTNPQYQVEVVDGDENDDDNTGTLIVGLMQKDTRKKKTAGTKTPSIGMMVYQMPGADGLLDAQFFKTHAPAAKAPPFINSREICARFKLAPGKYCIVPSTFNANDEAEFILRLFSEKENKAGELDEQTAIVDPKTPAPANNSKKTPAAAAVSPAAAARDEQRVTDLFKRNADKDGEIDAYKLRTMLNGEFQREMKFEGFSVDTCKSLVAMMDLDHSGKLGADEFKKLWNNVTEWKNVFKAFDADKSGNFNSFEMREALRSAGYSVTNATFNALVQRFSSQDGKIYFDYFVHCIARLKTMFEVFTEMRSGDKAQFTLDQFVQTTMYS